MPLKMIINVFWHKTTQSQKQTYHVDVVERKAVTLSQTIDQNNNC